MKEVKVKILILNYNGKILLKECLDSVMAINYSDYSVVLIDNNSTDNSVEYVKSQYVKVEIVETGKNRFYGGGYNYFFKRDSEECFYLILNNDTIVDKNILRDMIAGVNKYGKENLYGPRIMFAKERDKIWYAGGKVNLYRGIIEHIGIRKKLKEIDINDSPTDYITGCCMLIHSSSISRLNGFDCSFKMYMEDVDLCMRARSIGLKSYFLSSPFLYHHVSRTVSNKIFRIICSYIKLSIKYTGVHFLFNVPIFVLRKIISKIVC